MPIQHKFYENDFSQGFITNNAILNITPYEPEIIVIGTFNPNTYNDNFADFFYGRNYFWPAFKNLFIHNEPLLTHTRMPRRGGLQAVLNPTYDEILDLCINLKLTFADLITEVLHNNNPDFHLLQNDNVVLNSIEYNLIQDGQNGNIGGLEQLNALGQVNWNTLNIINFLCLNPQIKTIYFTRQPTGIWAGQWDLIINHSCMTGRLSTNLYTPSGQGLPGRPRMTALLNHWVHNDNPRFGQLDNDWLLNKGVNIQNF